MAPCEWSRLRLKIPDPEETPAAHETTLVTFYVCTGAYLFLGFLMWRVKRFHLSEIRASPVPWRGKKEDNGTETSDQFHVLYFLISSVGNAGAAVATQAYPGDVNWAMKTSKAIIILAWTCQVVASCGTAEAVCHTRWLKLAGWIIGLLVVLASFVELVVPGDRYFQGSMYCLAAFALVCAFAWGVAAKYDKKQDGISRRGFTPSCVFRSVSFICAAVGYGMVAVFEPDCGYAAHAVCYWNCGIGSSPGFHFAISLVPIMAFSLLVIPVQCCDPLPFALPASCCCCRADRPKTGPLPDATPVMPRSDGAAGGAATAPADLADEMNA